MNLVLLHLVSIRVTISLELFRERFLNLSQLLGIDLGLRGFQFSDYFRVGDQPPTMCEMQHLTCGCPSSPTD